MAAILLIFIRGVYYPAAMIFRDIEEYRSHFLSLIEKERREEMRRYMEEIRRLSGTKREKLGRAILNLRGKDAGHGLGGVYLIKFSRQNMPETEISVGDVVLLSKGKVSSRNPQGTVYEKGRNYIVVAFSTRPPRFLYGKGIRMDLYVSDITFRRMINALEELSYRDDLIPLLLGKEKLKETTGGKIKFFNEKLNESQRIAVERALASEKIFLIHGPPGTGKTTTLVEAIIQHVNLGEKVLATADSNVAVDNLVERLRNQVNVVRVGNPARITPSLLEHTLDYLVQFEEEYKAARKIWEEIDKLAEEREAYLKPVPQRRRGLSDDEILYLARSGRGLRGISVESMRGMAKWIEVQRKIDEKVKKAKELEEKAVRKILKGANVICATNSTAGSELLQDFHFDTIFIDEATQSTEPSCLIPLVKGRKLVMAGDHKQLPPTVMSMEARGLQYTLFERMHDIYGDKITHLLRVQYRMNEKIMGFSNLHFYNGALISHPSVRNITLKDFPLKWRLLRGWILEALRPENVVVFIDTCGRYPERQRRGSTSYENEGEAEIVESLISSLTGIGMQPHHIGVITPYDDQVELLKSRINYEGLEIKSVDGFQGREKEVIILSFVRSNTYGNIGFLWDYRRLNVSLTRAKRKLIMIGDAQTLRRDKIYDSLIQYVEKVGKVLKLCA